MAEENEREGIVLGGIRDMEGGENSLEIDSLARFAVEEHNKKEVCLSLSLSLSLSLTSFSDFVGAVWFGWNLLG